MYPQFPHINKDDFVVITSACSYGNVFRMFSERLPYKNIKVIHVGEPGRSNKWITHSIMHTLSLFQDHPRDKIMAVAMLSSVDRKDLHINREVNEFQKTIDYYKFCDEEYFIDSRSYRLYKWYDDVINGSRRTFDPNDASGLLGITNIPKHKHESDVSLVNIAQAWMEYFYTESGEFEETLNNILSLQNYCKNTNVPVLFLSWQDIFYDTNSVDHGSGRFIGQKRYFVGGEHTHSDLIFDYSKLEKRIDKYPQFKYLYDQIDFSKWWFSKSERCQTGGMADWLIERDETLFGGMEGDFCHPTKEGYIEFINRILNPLVLAEVRKSGFQIE